MAISFHLASGHGLNGHVLDHPIPDTTNVPCRASHRLPNKKRNLHVLERPCPAVPGKRCLLYSAHETARGSSCRILDHYGLYWRAAASHGATGGPPVCSAHASPIRTGETPKATALWRRMVETMVQFSGSMLVCGGVV